MKRRQFIRTSALATTATALLSNMARASVLSLSNSDKWGNIMPMRPLGKTGEKITIMGLGGAHNSWLKKKDAEKQIEMSIEAGIRFFDTASVYSNGLSEKLYGKYLNPKYRDEIFLMTKTHARDAATVEEHVHTSLKRMKTDRIDLILIHSLQDNEDVDNREKQGVFDRLQRFQSDGIIRHLGYSCHTNASVALYFLEKTKENDFICAFQSPINAVDASDPDNSFTTMVIPEIIKRGHSHFAMKTLGGGGLVGGKMDNKPDLPRKLVIPDYISLEENIHFVLSQPVTTWISGVDSLKQWEENISVAQSFSELSEARKIAIIEKVAGLYEDKAIEAYKIAQT